MVLRIFFALLTLVILGLAIASSVYILQKVEKPKVEAVREIRDTDPPKPIDPGIGEFEAAMDLIQKGELHQARDKLRHIIRYFPKSARYEVARQLCSQINLDLAFSPRVPESKSTYEVKRGDALGRIAEDHRTTLEYIKCVNGLVNFTIRPGDQLMVRPLDFQVSIDTGAKTLTLTEGAEFFAEYPVQAIVLPGRLKPPFEDEIKSKAALLEEAGVSAADRGYDEAQKQLRLGSQNLIITSPSSSVPEAGETPSTSPETGIFMDPADLEELNLLLRVGTPVRVAL